MTIEKIVYTIDGKILLSKQSIAHCIDAGTSTIDEWRRDGEFPAPDVHLTARQPRWSANTVLAWAEKKGLSINNIGLSSQRVAAS